MPHVILDHSADVADTHDMAALCDAVFDTLAAHPAVPNPASLKIRAIPATAHRLGTDPQSFVHATLWLLPGRDAGTKSSLTAAILACLDSALPDVGSLSVNLGELDAAYAKRVL